MYHVVNNTLHLLYLHTHIGDLTLNSNITCDLLSEGGCILIQDGITLDCNGYSIIGPGHDNSVGLFVFGNNTIIKNCNVENFRDGIQTQSASGLSSAVTVESTTFSKNDIGINQIGGSLTLKNVLVENNGEGHNVAGNKRMLTSAIIQLRISLLDPLTPLVNVLELKLLGKSLPVLSKVDPIAQLMTSSTNPWKRMDSVQSNRALISLLSNHFLMFDFVYFGWIGIIFTVWMEEWCFGGVRNHRWKNHWNDHLDISLKLG